MHNRCGLIYESNGTGTVNFSLFYTFICIYACVILEIKLFVSCKKLSFKYFSGGKSQTN